MIIWKFYERRTYQFFQ